MDIQNGRSTFHCGLAEYAKDQDKPLARQAKHANFQIPAITSVDPNVVLLARINHNRWIVDCPDCAGAQMVWLEAFSATMCPNCWNSSSQGLWRRVLLPADWVEIEAILKLRPAIFTRNWSPGETLDDLRAENIAHGLAAPGGE